MGISKAPEKLLWGIPRWVMDRIAEHYIGLGLSAAGVFSALAYAAAWVMDWARAVVSLIPEYLPPVLAIIVLMISGATLWRLAKMIAIQEDEMLRESVEQTYAYVQRVHKPQVINAAHPGNPDYMAEVAQDTVDELTIFLQEHGHDDYPSPIDIDSPKSVLDWYEYLRIKRKAFHRTRRPRVIMPRGETHR